VAVVVVGFLPLSLVYSLVNFVVEWNLEVGFEYLGGLVQSRV
jgi:hypothetical protein